MPAAEWSDIVVFKKILSRQCDVLRPRVRTVSGMIYVVATAQNKTWRKKSGPKASKDICRRSAPRWNEQRETPLTDFPFRNSEWTVHSA
jgi:hypothetical protein